MQAFVTSVVRAVSPQNLPGFMSTPDDSPTASSYLHRKRSTTSDEVERTMRNAVERLEYAKRLDANERYAEALAAYGVGLDALTALVAKEYSTDSETRRAILARLEPHRKRTEWIKSHLALCETTRPFRYEVMSDMVREWWVAAADKTSIEENESVRATTCIRESGRDSDRVYGGNVKIVIIFRLSWCLKNRYQRNALLDVLRSVPNRESIVYVEIDGANVASEEFPHSATSTRLKTEFFPTILVLVPGKRVLELHNLSSEFDRLALQNHLK